MVRKTIFTREDVIAAGVSVVENGGLGALSARRVAEELGASTAPVYSNFANMDELAIAVKQAVTDQLLEYTTREFTDDAFANIGIGVLAFTREKPSLYGAIFVQHSDDCESDGKVMAKLAERMESLDKLRELTIGERMLLLHQMAIYTHGLAVHLSTGLAPNDTFEELLLLLEDTGAAMTKYALSRPQRSPAMQKLMENLVDQHATENGANDESS